MKKPLVSIIIPCYNEEANLKRGVLRQVAEFLHHSQFNWEVIISDDGSTDGSLTLIKKFIASHAGFFLLANPHAGKPFALKSAIFQAKGEYVLLTDMDQSTPISEISKLLPWTDQGFQVVIGSRGSRRSDSTLFRQFASIIFQTARRAILLPRIKDTQCGFKLLKTELARKIFSEMRIFFREHNAKGWKVTAYDVEMLFLARRHRQPIKEVRVIWNNEDTESGKNKNRNFVKESIEMIFEILRVRVNDLLGKYD